MTTFEEFVVAAAREWVAYPSYRWGQALFNVLHSMRPELADEIRGTTMDPFHRDDMAPVFLGWVATKLRATT